eukprot:3587063-Prymnesium_polylepis.1
MLRPFRASKMNLQATCTNRNGLRSCLKGFMHPSTKRKVRAYGGDLPPPFPLRVGSSPSDFHRDCAQI